MSTLFGNLKEKTQGMEQAQDRVFGGGYVIDSDIYEMTLKAAYVGQSSKGANFMHVIFKRDGEDTEYREDVYFTSGNDKGGTPYYEKNGKKLPLPGYTVISDLCLILGGAPLEETDFQEKTLKVYDPESKTEQPKSVMVPVELLDKKLLVGVLRSTEIKQAKDATGNYVDTDETRDTNSIDKLFDLESKRTVVEAMNGAEEAVFFNTWLETNKGKVIDRTKKKDGKPGQSGAAGAPPKAAGAAASAPKKSLFGNK